MKYTCDICERVFSQKGHLNAHKKRKTPCKKENTIEELIKQKVKEALITLNEENIIIDNPLKENEELPNSTFEKMKLEELKKYCKENKIKYQGNLKKSEIIRLIQSQKIIQKEIPEISSVVKKETISSSIPNNIIIINAD